MPKIKQIAMYYIPISRRPRSLKCGVGTLTEVAFTHVARAVDVQLDSDVECSNSSKDGGHN